MPSVVKVAAVCVLVLSLGLHWALLQTVAWTSMVLRYSQTSSFKEALGKTFDGKHPCALCKAIQKGRAQEQERQQQVPPLSKLDLAVLWQSACHLFPCGRAMISCSDLSAPTRYIPPPKPHPRPASLERGGDYGSRLQG